MAGVGGIEPPNDDTKNLISASSRGLQRLIHKNFG